MFVHWCLVWFFLLFACSFASAPVHAQSNEQGAAGKASSSDPAHSDPPPNDKGPNDKGPSKQELVRAVEQLGDAAYAVRNDAASRLAKWGPAAREALLAGLEHEDAEVRRRCRRLLGDVLVAQYRQDLKAFIADKEGQGQHDLPGWKRFQQVVGNSQDARKLFIEMHKAEGLLFCAMESGGASAVRSFRYRFQQATDPLTSSVKRSRSTIDWPAIAAFLFAASDPALSQDMETEVSLDAAADRNWSNLLRLSAFRKALKDEETKDLAQKVLGVWIADAHNDVSVQRRLSLALQHNIPQGLILAARCVDDQKIDPNHRVYAIHVIGKQGGKPHAARLLPLLDDKGVCRRSVVIRNGKREEKITQLRDVALAWLIYLTDQNHADYNLPRASSTFRLVSRMTYISVSNFSFSSDKERQEALDKWTKYIGEHPLPAPPPTSE